MSAFSDVNSLGFNWLMNAYIDWLVYMSLKHTLNIDSECGVCILLWVSLGVLTLASLRVSNLLCNRSHLFQQSL